MPEATGNPVRCAYGPCGQSFIPQRPWARYHSTSCRVKASHDRRFISLAPITVNWRIAGSQPKPAAPPVPDNLTIWQRICGLLYGQSKTVYQIQDEVFAITGVRASDAAISARIRDLRKPRYGGYAVDSKPVEGKKYFEYTIARP